MRRVDGYLSQRAQRVFPKSLVVERDDGFWLENPDQEDLGLGDVFGKAHQALLAVIRAEESRRIGGKENG